MKLSKLNYRDLVLILFLEKSVFRKLFKDDKRYEQLLDVVDKYASENEGLPYQKDLLKSMKMSRTNLMDLMQGLYEEFQTKLCSQNAYKVTNTEIWLLINSREDYWVIGVDRLNTIPRVGDSFTIEFIRGEWGGQYFEVKKVSHELENGIHKIDISLYDKWAAEGNTTY